MARRHKKQFPCGHRGQGRYCHRCAQDAAAAQERQSIQAARQAERAAWDASFEYDSVDLRVIRHRPGLVQKARETVLAVAAGVHPFTLGGKAFRSDRNVVSVAISYDYRLVFHADGQQGFLPVALESHETYNHRT